MSSCPLRLLFVTNNVWTRELGAPRVQLELAEALVGMGHRVDKFSYEDAFPRSGQSRPRLTRRLQGMISSYRSAFLFSRRARARVRSRVGAYDVIDANHADLPYTKAELGFDGLLVARSVALIPAYLDFDRMEASRWPRPRTLRQLLHDLLAHPAYTRRIRDVEPSLRAADLISVSNSDDLARVRDGMGFGPKVVQLPFGLMPARRAELEAARRPVADRLAARTVAFIGAWNNRKGASDWPLIVPRVLRALPEARVLLLGTGFDEAHVRGAFDPASARALLVVPRFRSEDLPFLLGPATVGAFPGYMEGFGFGVLEMLAAGLPTLAYDAPGPRDMLRLHAFPSLLPVGGVEAFAAALVDSLRLPPERYAAWSQASLEVASRFCWEEIARRTAGLYRQRLEALGPRPGAHAHSGR